jgi:UDP-3-O-[3-hydroxymyristoyl] N-acetylglucosamine deacetylase
MIFRRLTRAVSFSGSGLHTGVSGTVTVVPNNEGRGVTLRRERKAFPLEKCRFTGTGRGTEIFLPDGSSLKTPEHLFGALSGLGIWSAAISAEGPEVPALDGCAATFASALEEASRPLGADENMPGCAAVSVPVAVQDEARRGVICAFPDDELHISSVIDYEEEPIGTQLVDYRSSKDDFRRLFAPARTFALESEIGALLERGLAKGGSLENSVVVGEKDVRASGGLRFADEFVRHKILDILGDLYLLGRPLRARIVALRSGHTLNCRLVERILTGMNQKISR